MIFLLVLLTLSAIFRELALHFSVHNGLDLSPWCLQVVPTESVHQELLASLLCGQKITDPILSDQLQRTALFHLFVFSGARLFLLENILERFLVPNWVRLFLSGFLTLFSGARSALVRAFVRLRLPRERSRWGPRGRADLETLKAGLLTLALVPEWISSLGLLLSWSAAFALTLPLGSGWRGGFRRVIALWIFTFPLVLVWGVPTPVTWLMNLILTPVFILVMIPLALFALAGVVRPFDFVVEEFLKLLGVLGQELPGAFNSSPISVAWQWVWLGALHVLAHGILIHVGRARR